MQRPPIPGPTTGPTAALVGFGYHALAVADLCAEAGRPVAFAVDDTGGGVTDTFGSAYWLGTRGIPVVSADEFAERVRRTPDLELVAVRVECDRQATTPADDPFARAQAWVRRTTGRALLHPAALVGRVPPLPCPGRYAMFGFPGSGNVLTQNLVDALYDRHQQPYPTAWALRAPLTEYHFHSVAARIRALLAPLNTTHLDFASQEFGTMLVDLECGPERAAVVFHVPNHRYLGLRRFATHSRPTADAVDYFTGCGGACVAIVRHPLETLLSQANKIARPPTVAFDGPQFLDRAADQLADWTAHLLANRDRLIVVRYEDMAARRIDELRRAADRLGMPVTDAEAGELFDRFLNRNLPSSVPTHFFRGGSDKWRAEFRPADLRRAMARLPAETFTAFGYEVPTEADLTHSPAAPPTGPAPPAALHATLLEAFPFYPVPGRHGMQVTSGDAELVDALVAAFQDPELLALLDAGGLTTDTRPKARFERSLDGGNG